MNKKLKTQGITIVSIDCDAKQTTSQPWQYNVADANGVIYHPYGVVSMPTYFLLSEERSIVGRYNKLEKILNHFEN